MSKNSTVYECTIIELDKHHRDEGNITVVENVKTVPFEVKRIIYTIYQVARRVVDTLIKNCFSW